MGNPGEPAGGPEYTEQKQTSKVSKSELMRQSPGGESCTDRSRNLHGEWSKIQLPTHQLVHAHEETNQSMGISI